MSIDQAPVVRKKNSEVEKRLFSDKEAVGSLQGIWH